MSLEKDNWCIYGLKIEDHAENDIVCAAISGLTMALIGILKHYGVHFNKLVYRSGLVDIDISPFSEEEGRRATDIMFQMAYFGLKQIEKKYPDRIEVVENTPIL